MKNEKGFINVPTLGQILAFAIIVGFIMIGAWELLKFLLLNHIHISIQWK